MRVPSTMRAPPWWAASQADRRCAGVMPLCRLTTACGPHWGAKRSIKRASSCGVRLISGTITKACAWGSRARSCSTACKYTSVLPLPVAPKSKNGPLCATICASASVCSALRALLCTSARAGPAFSGGGVFVCEVLPAAGCKPRALCSRSALRCSCRLDSSRSCGGKAASATSPAERW